MKILVACEESQAVTIELRKLGHEAYSCDIEPCSGGHTEWHIQQDVASLINGKCYFYTTDGTYHDTVSIWKWDMIIAFPPCTYLTNAGARHLWKNHELNQERYQKGLEAKKFFMKFYNADCERIAIENPTASKIYELPDKSQVIQPYQFGHPYTKRTQLWLKGLPDLISTKIVEPERTWCPSGSYSKKHDEKHRGMFTTDRAKNRSKTFPGIAKAMAEQWAGKAE
ncbi:DNA cytosine methyltransferase [Anaerosacchariphilus polymeriproducens]|uniref:DNA cytosine methyltransferase n=1 Tax=Anaerosacchariphilus polymeriproducens TaxID=1812858 RepID=A0A371AZL8_9FIRM|nr:DNA cytosine methyltransferase [Anaerosacchariphilus polymeriproducens]RDU25044.1 DNA cytosine methyltransferase [Anaerosacchariphilus polymeriproducens]